MFEASASNFVKCVGDKSLIPVPDLNLSDRCQVFQIVSKKRKRWCWQSASFELTPYQLKDLLLPTEDQQTSLANVTVKDDEFVAYNRTNKLSLSGKFGVQLKG